MQYVFQTRNETTVCFGSCDDEIDAVLCNLIEKDDVALIGIIGDVGRRATCVAKRYGAVVHTIESAPGLALTYDRINNYLEEYKPNIFFIAQGDPSTGVLQPIDGLGELCRRYFDVFQMNCVFS